MSMGLILYSVGHHRVASKNATFMYHEAAYHVDGKVVHHKQELKEVERVDKICDEILISKTKFTQEQLSKIKETQSDWYFDVNTALEYGLVDEVY